MLFTESMRDLRAIQRDPASSLICVKRDAGNPAFFGESVRHNFEVS
jgi:hypothetical protein